MTDEIGVNSPAPAAPRPHRVPGREAAAAAVLLFALIAVVHYDVVFQGKSFVLTNHLNPLDYRILPQNYGDHHVPAERWTANNLLPYANIQDPGGTWWQWAPAGEFLHQAMALREWPFWDPYIAGGSPAMANLTPAFFFPPYTAFVALGASVPLKNVYDLCLIWCAAFFSFLLLRTHGLLFVSALFGAMAVLLGGAVNQTIDTIMGQAICCLPICLYVTRRFLDSPTRRWIVILALTYASVSLASFPPVLFGIFGIAALYVLVDLAVGEDSLKARGSKAALWAAVSLLSVGLVGFYYLPAYAIQGAAPYVTRFYDGAGLETMPLNAAYQLLSPTLMGGVATYLTPPVQFPQGPHLPYAGAAVILLALLVTRPVTRRLRVLFYTAAVAALLIALKLFGVVPVQWLGHLPLLKQIHFAHYFGLPLGFLIAFLSALGMDSLLRGHATVVRALCTAAIGILATGSLWWIGQSYHVLESPTDSYWIRDLAFLMTLTWASTIVLTAGVCVPRLRYAAAALLIAAVAGEGYFNDAYPSPRAWDIFAKPTPYVRQLQEKAGFSRVLGYAALNANLNSAFGIYGLDSLMATNPARMHALYMRYTGAPPSLLLREATAIPPELVLDRASVGFLAIRDVFTGLVHEAQDRGYVQRFDEGYVSLFERPTKPRFFFSSRYRVLPPAEAIDAVATAPSDEVLIEEPVPFPAAPNLPTDPAVKIDAYHRNSVAVSVAAPRPGLLYASESFFDGWTATVNGVPAKILPANYAFRAVVIPAGSARVEFRYWPPGLTAGLSVSGVSLLMLCALAFRYGQAGRTPSIAGVRQQTTIPLD